MNTVDKESFLFFEENIKKTNKLLEKLFFIVVFLGPVLSMASYLELFSISRNTSLIATIMSISFTLIYFISNYYCKNHYFIMYLGITFMTVFINFLGSNRYIGIYISYALVPFLSCLYLNKKATIYSCFLGYVAMLVSLWGKAQTLYTRSLMNTPFEWWLPMIAGFTIEFFFVCLITYTIASKFSTTLERTNEKNRKIQNLQTTLIQSFANIVEWSDQYTGEHIKRTSIYVSLIAHRLREMGQYTNILTDEEIKLYENAAPLHDIGKINIPNNILSKPGRYTEAEYEQMKTHARTGYEIITQNLQDLENPEFIKAASDMSLYHHEHWDGTGYPNKISSYDIPLSARIMAAADVLDAMLSKRHYKEAFSIDTTLTYFETAKGTHFEPCISDAVLSLRKEILNVISEN